jgi:hypothetical protein
VDGVQAAGEIHDRLDIPVVYIAAYPDNKTLQPAKTTEPYGYILKPFEEREPHITIQMALYKHTMEKRLKENEAKYRELVENANSIILRWDTNGKITFCNEFANTFFGYGADDLLGKNVVGTITPERDSAGHNPIQMIRKITLDPEQYSAHENENLRKNGERVWVAWTNKAIRDKEGRIVEIVSVGNDVTATKRAEERLRQSEKQLRQSQKMEAIGRLAGGVAHDFNNLLMTISGYTELVLKRLDQQDPTRKYVKQIQKAGERAVSLTRQLLAFSRGQLLKTELDLNIRVNEIETMLRRLISEDIDFVVLIEPELKHIKANAGQIEQVMLNLAVNAADAMPNGGRFTIKTQNVINGEKDLMVIPGAPAGEFVCLSFEDTGSGMDKKTVDRIFDPFFTTKKKGTGLGLAIVYGIIKQHNGYITADSRPGKGSTFRIYLPAFSSKSADRTKVVIVSQKLRGNGEQILLVEDKKGVREVSTTVLRENGYGNKG